MKTLYIKPEASLGDRMKVVMLQVFDLMECDNLQVYEIKALIESELPNFNNLKRKKNIRKKRKSCGDDYKTITKYKGIEKNTKNSLLVIKKQIEDCYVYDHLEENNILSLIYALIDTHIDETE